MQSRLPVPITVSISQWPSSLACRYLLGALSDQALTGQSASAYHSCPSVFCAVYALLSDV